MRLCTFFFFRKMEADSAEAAGSSVAGSENLTSLNGDKYKPDYSAMASETEINQQNAGLQPETAKRVVTARKSLPPPVDTDTPEVESRNETPKRCLFLRS